MKGKAIFLIGLGLFGFRVAFADTYLQKNTSISESL
jgi:hypothetical protein